MIKLHLLFEVSNSHLNFFSARWIFIKDTSNDSEAVLQDRPTNLYLSHSGNTEFVELPGDLLLNKNWSKVYPVRICVEEVVCCFLCHRAA